jgi:tetratricopeptide (TPR) repeat protein
MARPSYGGGGGFGGGGAINRSPGFNAPRVNQPINRPSFQPPGGIGGGLSARDGPGIVTSPKLSPGTRPGIDVGQRPGIDVGQRPGIGAKNGIGNRPDAPGIGNRPSALPGLGLGAAGGYLAGKSGDILGRRQDRIQDRKDNLANRSQNLADRMQNRQDLLSQAQDKRQEFLNNRREDWQNWHDDYYHHHDGWYHGAWCDHWGDNWSHMWNEHPVAMAIGLTRWGLNRMSYWFGTATYENPYYSEPLVIENTTIDYSQPLAVPPVISTEPAAQAVELPPGVTAEGLKEFESARAAFYGGDYKKALEETNRALVSMPNDAVIHEFRALVLFALGKYHDAAATLHPVLAVGPGWDWTTMCSLYPSADTYTEQLRALEAFVTSNEKAADARFLLAYHYLTLGHDEHAAKHLSRVLKVVPNDTVTAQLLQMMGKSGPAAAPAAESDVKISVADLLGTWTATRGSKANFELSLGNDKSFKWVYREGKTRQEVKGAYALDGNVLALEPDAGGVMLAEISAPQNGAFDFRTAGAPKTDPGLRFQKKS